jgi:ArsR family transcriptional regulator
MDPAGETLAHRLDGGKVDDGVRHGDEYAVHARPRAIPSGRYLRSCAISERLVHVIVTQPTTEADRQRSAAVARALGDPKRLCVLESLADGEASVGELASRVSCQVPNMSQHLAVLRSAGLVATRRDGNTVYYSLTDPRVIEAYQLLQTIAR